MIPRMEPRGGMMRKLLLQTSHYSLGTLLTSILGLLSFPFFTRIFTVAEYGTMMLIATTVTFLTAIGKAGLQHAVLRFHSEVATGQRAGGLRALHSTAVGGALIFGGLTIAATLVGIRVVPESWLGGGHVRGLFALATVVVMAQTFVSPLVNVLRAEQASALLVTYQVVVKYVALAVVIGALLALGADLVTFYGATAVTEVTAAAVLWLILFGPRSTRPRPVPAAFSPALLRDMLAFGLPMMLGQELAGLVLATGDRYLIQGYLGSAALGIYSANYTLCQYVQATAVAQLGQASMPIYMRLWDEKGEAATAAFIEKSLRFYVLLGAPLVAGLTAVGPDLVTLLASEKYRGGAVVIPYVLGGIVIQGASPLLAAGLYITRQTAVVMKWLFAAAALNIGVNLVLIPRMGVRGAALATLVSCAGLTVALALSSNRRLRVRFPWRTLLAASAAAVAMAYAVGAVRLGGPVVALALKIALGAALYGAFVLAYDASSRDAVRSVLARLRGRPAAP
jgi:O-antigen/teichoic acid export membrane protein